MNMHASTLDIEKFRKVWTLAQQGATDGERANAKGRAEAMAAKAGVTLNDAVSMLDTQRPASSWRDAFSDMMSEAHRKQEAVAAVRRAEVLTRYRTIFDVFEQTAWERALRKAIEPFSKFVPSRNLAGAKDLWTVEIDRFHGEYWEIEKLSNRARSAIEQAIPFPATLTDALSELKVWDSLRRDRMAFSDSWSTFSEVMEVGLRKEMLRERLKSTPAVSWDDVQARFEWSLHDFKQGFLYPEENDRDDPFLDRLQADFQILRAMANNSEGQTFQPPAQNGRRTNADKAGDVQALLNSNPELADREIARRVGVSPQTVGNWRARLNQGNPNIDRRQA